MVLKKQMMLSNALMNHFHITQIICIEYICKNIKGVLEVFISVWEDKPHLIQNVYYKMSGS